MSFSTQVKDDLSRVATDRECCRRAEFIAFFLIGGNIRFSGRGSVSLTMSTEHAAAARRMFTLSREFVEQREITIYRRRQLKKTSVYNLIIPPQPQVKEFLSAIGMMDATGWQLNFPGSVERDFLREACCQRAYLRGAFLASGSVTDPEGAYHLEISNLDASQSDLIIRLLAGFGVEAKQVQRKGAEVVYIKEAEQISDFLNVVGGHRSLLEFESVRVVKEVRNNVNRVRNCDTANVNKTVAAAGRQCQEIDYIFSHMQREKLPPALRSAAELRLDNPEASLSELADSSGLGRSALNHRLRRLMQIADNIRSYGPEQWYR